MNYKIGQILTCEGHWIRTDKLIFRNSVLFDQLKRDTFVIKGSCDGSCVSGECKIRIGTGVAEIIKEG